MAAELWVGVPEKFQPPDLGGDVIILNERRRREITGEVTSQVSWPEGTLQAMVAKIDLASQRMRTPVPPQIAPVQNKHSGFEVWSQESLSALVSQIDARGVRSTSANGRAWSERRQRTERERRLRVTSGLQGPYQGVGPRRVHK